MDPHKPISLLSSFYLLSIHLLSTYLKYNYGKSIISARHRRLRGQYPLWGTAWVPMFKSNNGTWRQYDPHASTPQPANANTAPPYAPPPYTDYYVPPPGPPQPPQQQQYEMQGPFGGVGSNNDGQFSRQEQTGQHMQPPYSPPPVHLPDQRKDYV